jgi:hypothetical protein
MCRCLATSTSSRNAYVYGTLARHFGLSDNDAQTLGASLKIIGKYKTISLPTTTDCESFIMITIMRIGTDSK